jgi:hypothetical protein
MAENERITLVVEGLTADEGLVRFGAFLTTLQRFSATLNKLDRDANDGKVGNEFEVSAVSYASPLTIVLEPRPVGRRPDSAHLIIASLNRVSDAIRTGGDLLEFDADLLEDIRGLAQPVGKQVKSVAVLFDGSRLDLTPQLATRVDRALAVTDECEGSIEGMLEQINIHAGANTFHIYPDVGPRKLTCYFPVKLYDDAVSAVGRKVEVTGTLQYRARADWPHMIAVREIEAFPPESQLPDWDDLRGRAPDATGGLPSEVFVREMRDGWR